MWKVLLSEGEPAGARSPELYEPLGTAAPSSGRLLPAASGSPGRGRRRGQRPSLMPALLAPHTARSSRAPCVRRPSAGGWSCGCTWCPTQGRCPTRSGSACLRGRGPRGSPRILPTEPLYLGWCQAPPSCQLQGASPSLAHTSGWASDPLWAFVSFHGRQAQQPSGMAWGLPSVSFTQHLQLGWAVWSPHRPGVAGVAGWFRCLGPVFQCSSCSQQFMQKKDLQSHMIKLHGAPKPHACPTCAKCFLSRTELQLHEAFKHRGEKLFVCEECGHRASSRNGLQLHIKAKHRNERPYVCEFCSHAFTQKANLNMHLRTHTGEKPFQCHLCGKTFRTQASLDKHNRTHTGERPFSCEFCEQRFTEKGPLLRHVASRHQEGRPHFCQICGKTFKAVEQLRVHVRRHKGVRKFECTECGYKFTRQAHLRRHMEIHDRVENYNPRQRKLRNLVIEDEKMVVVALQPPAELEVGSAEVIVESLAQGSLASQLPAPRLCAEESFTGPGAMGPSLLITAAIPEACDT
uniref:Zinc finger and BTB domain-containing protein 48 n=1 Tax=Molossus molossus TaxID=27622 RepID=A0A7J8FDE4_MOLMO|nr:zinc finger and BTB domain containing 48 [Molossus molossus]